MAQSAEDFLGPQTADDFLGAPPTPPTDKQTLGGFGQSVATVVPRALTDIAGLPVDTAKNLFDLGKISGVGLAQAAGGEAGETNPDEYAEDVDTSTPVPGSSEWAKDQVRKLGGSSLIDAKERTTLNRYTQAIGEGAVVAAAGGAGTLPAKAGTAIVRAAESEPATAAIRTLIGTEQAAPTAAGVVTRSAAAGGAAGATQQAAADQGFSPGSQAALGFLAGAATGARGGPRNRIGEGARAPEEAPTKSSAEQLLDTPDIAHEGAGAAVEPAPRGPGAPPEPTAAPGASAEAPAAAGAASAIGAGPLDMTKSPEERAAERERIAALRDREEGKTPEFTPEPIPKRAALAEGEAARRDAAAKVAPQDSFMADFHKATTENPDEPAARKLGGTSIYIHADPADPNTVHIGSFRADEAGTGAGTAAMKQLTKIADEHGANISLDARPLLVNNPIPQAKLDQFYQNHGFEPAETGGGAMVRLAAGNEPPPPGMTVHEGELPEQTEPTGDKHPMRSGQPYTLLSANRADATPSQNHANLIQMGQTLKAMGANFAHTQGAFKEAGQSAPSIEPSFAVHAPNEAMRSRLEALASRYNQDSVIHVDENNNASYKNLGGDQQSGSIGTMQKVPQAEAEASPGWTKDAQGNHYIIKTPPAAEPQPATKNGMGENPPETMKSMFEGGAKEGQSQAAKTPAQQQQRVDTFKHIGLNEVRNSAISGDTRAAGTEFQTSKLKNEAGERLAGLIDDEREAVRKHAQQLVSDSGGSAGLGSTELYSRGSKMEAPINAWGQHLEDEMKQAYDIARERAKGKPFVLDTLGHTLANEKAQFLSTVEGKQLYEGVMARAKELGLTGPNETFNPSTVDQAERFRQYLNDAWSPRVGRLVGQLKSNLDRDVMKSAGEDLFERGRNIRTLIAKTLEEPEAVSQLMHTKEANKLGVNRSVPQEDVPSFITKQPFDQFRQYISVLKQAAGANVPALRTKALTAMNETRAQFANEYFAAGDNLKGMWNQKAANKYLKDNEMSMRYVFTPEEMQEYKQNDDAGRWLSMDRSYPGAEAQKQNLLARNAGKVGTLAEAAGAHLGAVPGYVAGHLVGKAAEKAASYMTGKQAEKLITPLDKWKPEGGPFSPIRPDPLSSKLPGQRGGPKSTTSPAAERIKEYLTPQERTQLRSDTTQRMVDAFHNLPPTHELAAAALAGQAKKGWYRNSAESIANVFGPDAPRFAAVLAAMSPQTSVQMNFHNAVRTFINWDKAGRPHDPAVIRGIMQDSVMRQPNGEGVLHAWVPNTIRALTHPNPDALPTPPMKEAPADMLSFRHFSNAKGDKVTLDPSYYGSGVPGAEAKRIAAGAPKVTAAYAADHPDNAVEQDVRQGRTEYQIRAPRDSVYDLSADPHNIKQRVADQDIAEGGMGVYDHSRAEQMMKDEGYAGYHIPNGAGNLKGQARFFKPMEATKVGVPATASELQLSGPKVNSFMHNLRNNVNEVTLDSWMAAFAKIDPSAFKGKGNKSSPGKSPGYLAYSAKVREAASMLSHLTGEKWTPAEVQETVWSWAKTAYEHAAAEGKDIPNLVKRGDISDELIRATPDFQQLFSSPEHAGFIAGSRYAQGANRLAGNQGQQGTGATGSAKARTAAAKTLKPHLARAAERLQTRLTEKRESGEEAPF